VEKFIDTPVKRYSSGMYVRLAFAVAAHLEPEILLVDEVLAVGDAEFQKKCLGKMSDVAHEGRTVLFVSHNMGAVLNLCKFGLLLDHGQVIEYGPTQKLITRYYKTDTKQKKEYSSGPIKSVSSIQNGEIIELCVEYNLAFDLRSQSFGFVISDYAGRKICGTNQKFDNLQFDPSKSHPEKTFIRIIQPKLYNGTYKLSIFLGNGYKDFFIDMECLEFEILNMASPNQNKNSINESGAVYPICEWGFC
jgi:ABC-type multidrug transport system ATPase subunit